jgi:Zn-dependent protease/CBS domain-containing protein
MRTWSISAGKIFGVELRIHVTFLILLAFVWVTEWPELGYPGVARGLALLGIVFAAVILHELGHALAALQAGVAIDAILLLPIGGIAITDGSALSPGRPATDLAASPRLGLLGWRNREIRIALAGPLISLAAGGFAAVMILAVAPEIKLWGQPLLSSANLVRTLVWANLGIGLLNLLPAYPLDAGHVLRALLARRLEFSRATRRAVFVGQVTAMLFMLAGFLLLNRDRSAGMWLVMVGIFLSMAAQLEERTLVFHSVLQNVRLEDVMLTDFSTLSPADTLEDALAKAVHTLQDDFPVVRGSDMVGIVSRHKILDALRADGNAYVQSVMTRVFDVAARGESLANAFRRITSQGLSMVPVVDQGRLVGIVTLQNLMHSMGLLAESRRLRQAEQELDL